MSKLGEQIRAIRKQRGLTLVVLATHTGIDQATLSRIENGKMAGTLSSYEKIAQALGTSVPDLYLARKDLGAGIKDRELAHELKSIVTDLNRIISRLKKS